MRRFIILFFINYLFFPSLMFAQSLLNSQVKDSSWVYRVKQIQQFIGRFNHSENIRGIQLKFVDDIERRTSLATLFSKELVGKADRKNLIEFVNEVIKEDVQLSQQDTNWYAFVNCQAKYKQQNVKVNLALQMQINSDSSVQWMIVGARANELVRMEEHKEHTYLLGNAHELNFMRLFIELEEQHKIKNLISSKVSQDHLSIISWLIHQGDLILQQSTGLSFHFCQVPGWFFSVKEFNRKDYNSGWLIYNLERYDPKQKNKMLSEKLGINL